MTWVDREGREEPLPLPPGLWVAPRLSPDGSQVAFSNEDGDQDVWVYDLKRDSLTRVTSSLERCHTPISSSTVNGPSG